MLQLKHETGRILSPLFIGVDIDLRYFITVLLSVFIIVTFFLRNTIYTCGMQTKCSFFIYGARLNRGKKKTQASSICKRFLFPDSNEPPKVTTPLKLRPSKAANSESSECRYYQNSTTLSTDDAR